MTNHRTSDQREMFRLGVLGRLGRDELTLQNTNVGKLGATAQLNVWRFRKNMSGMPSSVRLYVGARKGRQNI